MYFSAGLSLGDVRMPSGLQHLIFVSSVHPESGVPAHAGWLAAAHIRIPLRPESGQRTLGMWPGAALSLVVACS